jgi:hypothetical protein
MLLASWGATRPPRHFRPAGEPRKPLKAVFIMSMTRRKHRNGNFRNLGVQVWSVRVLQPLRLFRPAGELPKLPKVASIMSMTPRRHPSGNFHNLGVRVRVVRVLQPLRLSQSAGEQRKLPKVEFITLMTRQRYRNGSSLAGATCALCLLRRYLRQLSRCSRNHGSRRPSFPHSKINKRRGRRQCRLRMECCPRNSSSKECFSRNSSSQYSGRNNRQCLYSNLHGSNNQVYRPRNHSGRSNRACYYSNHHGSNNRHNKRNHRRTCACRPVVEVVPRMPRRMAVTRLLTCKIHRRRCMCACHLVVPVLALSLYLVLLTYRTILRFTSLR